MEPESSARDGFDRRAAVVAADQRRQAVEEVRCRPLQALVAGVDRAHEVTNCGVFTHRVPQQVCDQPARR
jgi:hypothetical protein